jgi:hypothetical protein
MTQWNGDFGRQEVLVPPTHIKLYVSFIFLYSVKDQIAHNLT